MYSHTRLTRLWEYFGDTLGTHISPSVGLTRTAAPNQLSGTHHLLSGSRWRRGAWAVGRRPLAAAERRLP